jgi:hypothetical protein
VAKTITADVHDQFFTQSINDSGPYSVKAACDLICVVIKFPACMKVAENRLYRILASSRVFFDRDTSSLVFNRDAPVRTQDDVDESAVAVECFIYAVVQNFPHKLVQAFPTRSANVHSGPLAYRLEPFQHLDIFYCIRVTH